MSTPEPIQRQSALPDVLVRLAEGPEDERRCRDLISGIYAAAYAVEMTTGKADPDGGLEAFPHRFVMGLAPDGQLVACAGLYTRDTYVERYGQVSLERIAAVARAAGVTDPERRRRYEFTKIVVAPGWGGKGLGRRFIGAAHARDFLCADSGGVPPLVLVCAKLSVFKLWDAVGIHSRFLKSFPLYRNHERYRRPEDPMESRLVIPEKDVARRWYDLTLPASLNIHEPRDSDGR
jgi:hypothetical protein